MTSAHPRSTTTRDMTTTTKAGPSTATTNTDPSTTVTTASPTTTSPPQCARLADVGAVQMSPGAGQPHVGDVTYAIDGSTNPDIEIAGRLAGTPATGQSLYVVKTGIPGTYDSTVHRYPASRGFFMHPEITLGSGGCWTSPPHQLGYDCVAGVGFRFYFALIPQAVGEALAAQGAAAGDDGLPRESILENPDVDIIGAIEVTAPPQPGCPG